MSELRENEQPATTAPFRLLCTGCGADSDAPDQVFQSEAEGLFDRYQDLVETYHHHFEAQYEEVEGCPVLDLSALEIVLSTGRLSTPPMETLAASRACVRPWLSARA